MEAVLSLLTTYGAGLLFSATLLSCLALPVPASLVMLVGGGFVASGDMALSTAVLSAWVGAVIGDQLGYGIGRIGGDHLRKWLKKSQARTKIMGKAEGFMHQWGGMGVYLSRWLFSPLGPYVNFAAGLTSMRWLRFTLWDALGEASWVGIYVGLGFVFADHISMVADIAGNLSGLLAAGGLSTTLGFWLWKRSGKLPSRPHI